MSISLLIISSFIYILYILFYIGVFALTGILLPVSILIYLFILLPRKIFLNINCYRYYPAVSKLTIKKLEEDTLCDICKKCVWIHYWHKIKMPWTSKLYNIHTILVKSFITKKEKPLAIFIHGSAASSTGFSYTWDILSNTFDILCIDLPGFGRSYGCSSIYDTSPEEITNRYIDIIYQVIKNYTSSKVVLIGHSFGGFLCGNFIKKYENIVDTVIFINSAGIFPTLGNTGAYWALYFKSCFPQYFLRNISHIGIFIVYTIFELLQLSTFSYYYLQLLSAHDYYGDIVCSQYIYLDYIQAYWKNPVLCNILNSNCKVAFVYGKNDPIMVPSQIDILTKISKSDIPLLLIDNASHFPYSENTIEFCKCIIEAYVTSKKPTSFSKNLCINIKSSDLLKYKSNFNINHTNTVINELYSYLIKLSNNI